MKKHFKPTIFTFQRTLSEREKILTKTNPLGGGDCARGVSQAPPSGAGAGEGGGGGEGWGGGEEWGGGQEEWGGGEEQAGVQLHNSQCGGHTGEEEEKAKL